MAEPWESRARWLVKRFGDDSYRTFAKKLKLEETPNPETVRLWMKGQGTPNLQYLAAIVQTHPEVNPEWLVTGRGDREREKPGEPPAAAVEVMAELRTLYDGLASRFGPEPAATSPPPDPNAGPRAVSRRRAAHAGEEEPKGRKRG